ncbi:hypothetical protein DSI28_00720, partial [Mycobacterium tuberculosis]|uniref:hypothetical protein n=1 Tax=Mycobacterium tuberculosis TaxID=1773 RepID=UPI000E3B442B
AAVALGGTASAAPVGNLRAISATPANDGTAGWTLSTDTGATVRVDLLRDDVLRVRAGRNGTLTGAGDKVAPIVLPQPPAK